MLSRACLFYFDNPISFSDYFRDMYKILYTIPEWFPFRGGRSIYSYGVLMGLGIGLGYYLYMYFTSRAGIPRRPARLNYFLIIVGGLLGGRLVYMLTQPEIWSFGQNFWRTLVSSGGRVAYGNLLGLVIGGVYLRLKKIDIFNVLDCAAPSIGLGYALGRIGCFLSGCCHGKPTDLPWAVTFPSESPAATIYSAPAGYSLPLHPSQLYESLFWLTLGLLAVVLLKKRRFTGQVIFLILGIYSIGRFFLEFLRGDIIRGFVFDSLSTSQFVSLIILPICIVGYIWRSKKKVPG
jgi:phosphatidylglycerol:prolipoprotein diacylglycerol transferase